MNRSYSRTSPGGWRLVLEAVVATVAICLATHPLRRATQKRTPMTDNRRVLAARTPVAEPPHEPAWIPCDRDQSCARAICEVIVVIENVTKKLYFCGHHYHENQIHIFERGYEVNEL